MSAAETPGGALTRTSLESPGVGPRLDLGLRLFSDLAGTDRLRGRRVLVVGLDYSPTAMPVAPYTTGIAEHLATLAAGVTVLAGLPERADGRFAAPYRRGLRFPDPGWQSPEAPRVIRLRHAPAVAARPLRQAWHELTFLVAVALGGRRVDADLVVSVTPSAGGAAAAARIATRRGVPLVTVVQGMVQGAVPGVVPGTAASRSPARAGLAARVAAALVGRLETYALRRSREIAVTSEAYRPAVLAAGVDPERLHLMPNWTPLRAAGESRRAAREALGWPLDRFTVVHAGPLSHRQDLGTVVEAARLLAEREAAVEPSPDLSQAPNPAGPVSVVLVGDGPQRAYLEQQAFALGNVRFLDTDDDVHALVLAAADVLLVAEPGAGAPAVPGQLAAYLSAGRPVLAAVPESSAISFELRRAGGAGLRIEPGDPVALADAMAALRAVPRQRGLMGRTALRYARSQLSRAAALRRLELVVDSALARQPDSNPVPAPPPRQHPVQQTGRGF